MFGSKSTPRQSRRGIGRGGALAASLITLGVAASTAILISTPAQAASNVPVQLTLSGTAYANGVTGGSVVGVHPGDSVAFSASAAPTAGLPAAVGNVLGGLLGTLTGYQITITSSAVPGLAVNSTIRSACGLTPAQTVNTPALSAGQYDFTYSVQSLSLLCNATPITLDGNELAKAGVALNAANQYVGHIVAATNPPSGGLGVQLPTVSVQPSVTGVGTLPKVTVPGVQVTVPTTLPTSLTGLLPGGILPGGTTSGGATPTSGSSAGLNYTDPGAQVPDSIVPKGGGNGLFGEGSSGGSSGSGGGGANGKNAALSGANGVTGASASPTAGTVDLSAQKTPTAAQLPVVLSILAILALSLVSAMYARMYLLRRSS